MPNVAARGHVFFRSGQYMMARVVLGEAVRLAPESVESRVLLARSHVALGEPAVALQLLSDEEGRTPALLRFWTAQIRLASAQGRRRGGQFLPPALRESLSGQDRTPPDGPYYLAGLRVAHGDQAEALQSLERAFEVHSPSLMWLPTDPIWKPLRGSADFQAMVALVDSSR